ncbi:MAG: hypothetical protein OXK77_15945 [Gemmatimonadota bacterium]|nr:hypothetical protein [Gemmatimonadota bacterium]MDE2863515.1 hypothetical protein [Gemmatimonadota bacterium]
MVRTTIERQQIDAGQEILTRREAEKGGRVAFPAFSRVVLEDSAGKRHVFWLVERVFGDLQVQRTWTGTAIGGIVAASALDEGNVVSKNAPLGLLLDEYGERLGEEVPLPVGLQRRWGTPTATVIDCTHYIPWGGDAINGAMHLGAEPPLHFESLRDFVGELEDLVVDLAAAPELEVEIGEIDALLEERERKIRAFREAKRVRIRHVITSAALRNQPKLDAAQLQAKQRQILDGQVIIHGGPGTGKTTALLDRISLFTERAAIQEHVPGLSEAALDRLTDPDTAYLLFTPNELLLHYLKEAMNTKGLLADSAKLTTWRGYRDRLAQRFRLLTADAKRSRFVKDRTAFQRKSMTFDVQPDEWQAFIGILCEPFSEFVSRRHRRVFKIQPDASDNPDLVREVQNGLVEARKARSLIESIRIFQSLDDRGNEAATEARRQGTERIGKLARRLHAKIREDEQTRVRLVAALAEFQSDPTDVEEDGVDTYDQEVAEVGQRPLDDLGKEEIELINSLARSLLRKLALRRGFAGVRLTKREQTMLDHCQAWIDHEALEELAPTLLTSLVRPACAGPDSNVVAQAGPYYLWLRRNQFAGRLSAFLHPNVRNRLTKSGTLEGKRVGPDELDLVLFLQLWLLRLRRTVPSLQRSARSNLSAVFESSLREVIAVDEATDFSPIQLACMAMAANPVYDCVTLSGDLMQRMTDYGLRDWEEYESVAREVGLAPVHQAGLQVNYRQSRRLLSVTNRLYEAGTGSVAPTSSPYAPSEHDPPPLLHVGADLPDCAAWIARRVVEIRGSYDEHGIIPTIAVLVPDEPSVNTLADAMEDALSFSGNIEIDRCHGGRVLGEGAFVRIFNVEHIKGIEFEAAFFHDMGDIAARFPQLAEKLLYVGLSRASLYLGITAIGSVPHVLDPLVDDLKDGDWSV